MAEFGFVRAISAPADLPAIPVQIHFGFVRAILALADTAAISAQIHLSRGRPLAGGDVPGQPASTIQEPRTASVPSRPVSRFCGDVANHTGREPVPFSLHLARCNL
jgi:hypothetical protein